jgi:hypothetical protein
MNHLAVSTELALQVSQSGAQSTAAALSAAPPSPTLEPNWLPELAPPVPDQPTEREIISSMNIARTLLTRTQPQANLVPQPDSVGAIANLRSGRPDDNPDGPSNIRNPVGDQNDVTPFLISPVENTLIGPDTPSAKKTRALDLTWGALGVFEDMLWFSDAEDAAPSLWEGRLPITLSPAPMLEEELALALVLGIVLSSSVAAVDKRATTTLPYLHELNGCRSNSLPKTKNPLRESHPEYA